MGFPYRKDWHQNGGIEGYHERHDSNGDHNCVLLLPGLPFSRYILYRLLLVQYPISGRHGAVCSAGCVCLGGGLKWWVTLLEGRHVLVLCRGWKVESQDLTEGYNADLLRKSPGTVW
jgi:hypothetical protein